VTALIAVQEALKQKRDTMLASIHLLELTVENAYRDYCKQPYYLHAILVHDGSAESGHYYSFIFDQKQKRWWRFNDHSVSMELEEVVMREAIGGQQDSNKAAYMLIYANQFVVSKA
jgi:ubiquitin carboxyl-terminal hydrolase 25/28